METRSGLLLSWPWQKWKGLCSSGCAEWFFLRCTTSRLPTLEFGGFRNLEWLCEMKFEKKNQRFKYEFKHRLAFSQVGLNLLVGSQVALFRNLIYRLRNLKLNLRNGTRVPGAAFTGCENFRKLNSGLANLSFEDFASWPPFSQVGISTCEIFAS